VGAAGATLAFPTGVIAAVEIKKPSPFASVHFMPVVNDRHVKGLRVTDMP
jgi:hypothetical protein